jgi:hypothetical protein
MSACAVSLYFALEKWSSPSVRDDFDEVSFYLIFSLIWIALTQSAFAFLGISIRDDAAERRNRSAGFAAAGLTIAATCCVAGSNIGDGPGFEVVLFCAALATAFLLALWFVVAEISGLADAITIERDLGAGIRTGGWFAGSGAVLGSCVAGDWISVAATLKDFVRYAWPLAVFACGFGLFERSISRRVRGLRPSVAIFIGSATAMAVAGGVCARWIGRH